MYITSNFGTNIIKQYKRTNKRGIFYANWRIVFPERMHLNLGFRPNLPLLHHIWTKSDRFTSKSILERCDFTVSYAQFGNKNKLTLYRLSDFYTLFYFRYVECSFILKAASPQRLSPVPIKSAYITKAGANLSSLFPIQNFLYTFISP